MITWLPRPKKWLLMALFILTLPSMAFAHLSGTANPDTTFPEIVSVSVSPSSVDISTDEKDVTVSVSFTDQGGSGLDSAYVRFEKSGSPMHQGNSQEYGGVSAVDDEIIVTIPTGVDPGEYSLTVVVRDIAGNQTHRVYPDITVNVINSNPDEVGPEVLSASISPTTVDVSDSGKLVTISVSLTDSGSSGLDRASVSLEALNYQGIQFYSHSPNFGGTSAAGYNFTVYVHQGSLQDDYQLRVIAFDVAGNVTDQFVSEATLSVINPESVRQLSVISSGVGSGTISSLPSGIDCSRNLGDCSATFPRGFSVQLTATPESESAFGGWVAGDCADSNSSTCELSLDADRSATARFTLDNPPAGRIVAATLPGARSGYVSGGDITVFMTVLSRQSTPAQACRITAPNDPPFTLSYRQVNAQNEVIGDANPLFDLGNGGAINFVIALTPTRTTDQSGYVFLPRIQCENADLSPIEGVNSVLVSIGAAPVPDILSIGVTPSGDGVVRIPETGNRISFMSVAAVNNGAGDGSAGAGEATVTASVDTGAASLPLTLEVCETPSTGGCITPRGVDNVTTVFESNVAKYFAVFVRANGEATVPFDPANARVFLRFADANGTIRSATSAAVSAPAPAGDQPALQAAIPVGRWSVLVRQGDGEWPSLVRASLFVLEDGTAILDDDIDVTRLTFENFATDHDLGRFDTLATDGLWTGEGNIQAGPVLSDHPGDLWGVRDARSDLASGWDALAGQYGEGIWIDADGSINGTLGGCIVSGQPVTGTDDASGLRIATVNLMSCEASSAYRGVMDVPVNDDVPALVLSGTDGGWRIERNR